jgi:hypothetical protein
MNPDWGNGNHVALLLESNTAFGSSFSTETLKRSHASSQLKSCSQSPDSPQPLSPQFRFRFPLHISQMMSDVEAGGPPAISLLPASAVPLNLREITPPADQIPALRPQLTSPIVENEVNGILDNIEHEGVTAVGIVATDERDVLFVARLLKRQAPNVQLFLSSANLLYLHSDYLPYMRGAIVASTYPLYLPNQTTLFFDRDANPPVALTQTFHRRLFPSMVTEAVFNATQLQLGSSALRDYCDPSASGRTACMPPVWVSVLGDDGFWPLTWQSFPTVKSRKGEVPQSVMVNAAPVALHLPPLSGPMRFLSVLLLLIICAHAGIAFYAWARLSGGGSVQQFQRSPFVRVLAPPITYAAASNRHALALLLGFALLTELAIW